MPGSPGNWQPNSVISVVAAFMSSNRTLRVETDQGEGYLKPLGNPEGPHVLACEWVGTNLANLLKLPTFDFALIRLTDLPEIRMADGKLVQPGPAFITRAEPGMQWSGTEEDLRSLANADELSRLVLFDTWTLNCDRYRPEPLRIKHNNVYLSQEGAPQGDFLLRAMDNGHCFTCGHDLTVKVRDLDQIRDEQVYGLFPEFRPFLSRTAMTKAVADLLAIQRQDVENILASVPPEWDVRQDIRVAWCELICRRASFVAETIIDNVWPSGEAPGGPSEGKQPP